MSKAQKAFNEAILNPVEGLVRMSEAEIVDFLIERLDSGRLLHRFRLVGDDVPHSSFYKVTKPIDSAPRTIISSNKPDKFEGATPIFISDKIEDLGPFLGSNITTFAMKEAFFSIPTFKKGRPHIPRRLMRRAIRKIELRDKKPFDYRDPYYTYDGRDFYRLLEAMGKAIACITLDIDREKVTDTQASNALLRHFDEDTLKHLLVDSSFTDKPIEELSWDKFVLAAEKGLGVKRMYRAGKDGYGYNLSHHEIAHLTLIKMQSLRWFEKKNGFSSTSKRPKP